MEPIIVDYHQFTDEELVSMAQSGDSLAEDFVLTKYHKMVYIWTRSYFLQGGEMDDVLQEGMIGLFKAIRDFTDGSSSFWAFAKLCIIRNVISAIKGTTRQKHLPLNSYTSLNKPVYDFEGDRTLIEMIVDHKTADPETLTINREHLELTKRTIKEVLSHFEHAVFLLYLDGYSYKEIAAYLGTHTKSIDNALCRIKGKIEKYVS